MRRFPCFLSGLIAAFAFVVITDGLSAQDQDRVWTDPAVAAKEDPDFPVQGEYTSESGEEAAQVVARGHGQFYVVVQPQGLPDDEHRHKQPAGQEMDSEQVKQLIAEKHLKKVRRHSPTLKAEPPEGAMVLFDGDAETLKQHWQSGARMTDDGLLIQGATTTDTFGDYTLHVEFRLPYMPDARDQARGNSGVYHQGRYETQILDSFGLAGKDNETGGIYEISDPSLNMCFPPLMWQTYDVDYVAPRWDENGKKTANARITARVNGVVVQDNVEVPRITRAAPVEESPEPGPLFIQNHGNPVRFRNIWIVPHTSK